MSTIDLHNYFTLAFAYMIPIIIGGVTIVKLFKRRFLAFGLHLAFVILSTAIPYMIVGSPMEILAR